MMGGLVGVARLAETDVLLCLAQYTRDLVWGTCKETGYLAAKSGRGGQCGEGRRVEFAVAMLQEHERMWWWRRGIASGEGPAQHCGSDAEHGRCGAKAFSVST